MAQLADFQKDIQRRTRWSDAVVGCLRSKEEAEIYIKAGLKEAVVGGKVALIRTDIDWADYSIRRNTWLRDSSQQSLKDYDSWAQYNNADLIGEGFPPRDRNGDPYELHHIGQMQDSPFAELTWAEHMGGGNNTILHQAGKESKIDRAEFTKEKAEYWMARFKAFTKAELERIYL